MGATGSRKAWKAEDILRMVSVLEDEDELYLRRRRYLDADGNEFVDEPGCPVDDVNRLENGGVLEYSIGNGLDIGGMGLVLTPPQQFSHGTENRLIGGWVDIDRYEKDILESDEYVSGVEKLVDSAFLEPEMVGKQIARIEYGPERPFDTANLAELLDDVITLAYAANAKYTEVEKEKRAWLEDWEEQVERQEEWVKSPEF